ncbi:MAG: DNA mismatch repair endonuclease MutL, partial [Dehalococcoidia bacterium]
AGEVIERPVSVVRELLDNAIDADARRITVEVEGGGITLLRVTDDGRGIAPEQVELAFERHATSKIAALGDLRHVHTLGFRGEALPSIAAAADVEILTRAEAEPVGVHTVLVDAKPVRRAARAAPRGTSIAVKELFARLPARRKFLAQPGAEQRQITTLVTHYALAYPDRVFVLQVAGRTVIRTPGDGVIRHGFAAVYDAASAEAMLEVDHCEGDVTVTGLAGPPSLHRGTRAGLSVFVNGRWVQSRPLTFALVDAYQSQLPVGRHPVAAVRVTVADDQVDVNVHPAKAEVRFQDERAVARAVRNAVLRALDGAAPVSWLPRPVSAPGWGAPPALAPLRERLASSQALRAPAGLQIEAPGLATAPHATSPAPHRDLLPLLRVVGQLGSTYVIAEGPDGMYLVDQHAAHERVVYDRLLARQGRAEATQPLLDPVVMELDGVSAATYAEHAEHLIALGLQAEPFGERACVIRGVPAGLGSTDIVSTVRGLLDQLANDRRVADPFGRAAATVACHSSVRAGRALAMDEMRQLLADLAATATPRTCPHGRPTLVHVGTDLIERQFGRR